MLPLVFTLATELTTLETYFPVGVPEAIALSEDGTRLFGSKGAAVIEYDATEPFLQPLPELARIPIDSEIVRLLHDDTADAIFVAGGSDGLVRLDLDATAPSCPNESYGAFRLDDDDHGTPTPADNDKFCMDLAFFDAQTLVATFAARNASELRFYDLASARTAAGAITPTEIVDLPNTLADPVLNWGASWSLVVDGDHVYVAMGRQGIVRVDTSVTPSAVAQGPVLGAGPNPFFGQAPTMRDVAVAADALVATAGGLGVLQVNIANPATWSPAVNDPGLVRTIRVADASDPLAASYAHRVDVIQVDATTYRVAIGTNYDPAPAAEGVPRKSWGSIDIFAHPGAIDDDVDYEEGVTSSFHTYLMSNTWPAYQPATKASFVLPGAGARWNEIVLHDTGTEIRSYQANGGVRIHRVDSSYTELATGGGPPGLNPPRAGHSLLDPDLLLLARDGGGPNAGWVRTCDPDCIDVIPGTAGEGVFGTITNFDAQWEDPSVAGRWWLLNGTFDTFRLTQFDQGDTCPPMDLAPTADSRQFYGPVDSFGSPGRLITAGSLQPQWDPDVALFVFGGTLKGLTAWSMTDLMNQFPSWVSVPAPPMVTPTSYTGSLFHLTTHPEFEGWIDPDVYNQQNPGCATWGDPGDPISTFQFLRTTVLNFDVDTIRYQTSEGSRWVAAVASGFHARDPQDPIFTNCGTTTVPYPDEYKHSMTLMYDLDHALNGEEDPFAILFGSLDEGSASEVKLVKARADGVMHTYAVVADFGGALEVFDLTGLDPTPASPALLDPIASYVLPPGALDGRHENVIGLEIDREVVGGQQVLTAYLACYRRGVIVLDVSDPRFPVELETIDTPGLAADVHLRDAGGVKELIVSDRHGGLRVYGDGN